ncbi:hypothetical protein BHM03_00014559 [Ensete ventricosum]|nr:hypothetical protein BHM03_00014559 [Ensete ventricosum]
MLITTLPATAGELIFFFLLRSPAVVSHPMFATFSGTPRRFPYAADAASGICSTCCPHAINYRKHFMRNPHRT